MSLPASPLRGNGLVAAGLLRLGCGLAGGSRGAVAFSAPAVRALGAWVHRDPTARQSTLKLGPQGSSQLPADRRPHFPQGCGGWSDGRIDICQRLGYIAHLAQWLRWWLRPSSE